MVVFNLVSRPDAPAGAEAAVPQRKELPDADAAYPVPGARGRRFPRPIPDSAACAWLPEFLSILGRNSLNVFCVGSLLSLSGQIIRFLYTGSFLVDTIVVVGGVGLLWLTAWVSEWRERQTSAQR